VADARYRLSAEDIRRRLRATRPGPDPAGVDPEHSARRWPAPLRERLPARLTPAGVLIPIVEYPGELAVLLTRRSAGLPQHAGQVSFPGGRMEQCDLDIRATALRETHEEIGLEPCHVEVAGYLGAQPTITGYAVTPVVGLVRAGLPLVPDPVEVETVFEVPLAFLLDPANQEVGQRELHGVFVPIVEFRYGGERIWGATASIVVALRKRLLDNQ